MYEFTLYKRVSFSPHFSPVFIICRLFDNSCSVQVVRWYLIVVLICLSLIIMILSIFSCACWLYECCLWKNFYWSLLYISFFFFLLVSCLGFPCCSVGKESTCNVGDPGFIPGLGKSPGKGKGYPLQCSGLENSMDSKVHEVAKSWTRLSNLHMNMNIELYELFMYFW